MQWDWEQYWLKAKLYTELGLEEGRQEWERAFWSSLALEFLMRAALCKIHPSLNADPQGEGQNLFYALGFEIKGQPRSIPLHSVIARLERLLPDFKLVSSFCSSLEILRNTELHTSDLAFQGLSESKWLPYFYQTCQVLLSSIGFDLKDLFDQVEATNAQKLIEALASDKLADVKKKVAAHAAVFADKDADEKTNLQNQQAILASEWAGAFSKVACPSCESFARLSGELERESEPKFEDGSLFVERTYLATAMECGACGLHLKDLQELHHAGIEPHFNEVVETDLHDFYQPDYYEDYMNM